MLRKVASRSRRVDGGRFVVIASRYNARYVDSMLRAATMVLERARPESIEVIRVPGAFEIPVVAARLGRSRGLSLSAIVCLGVIIRGETEHAQLIAEAVTQALTRIQVKFEVPVIHEVLLLENRQQAEARCLDPEHNRGAEAAQSALAMAAVMARLPKFVAPADTAR